MLGRLSAPLFLFSVVEGFIHTHNRKKYFLRIYATSIVMGVISYIMMMCRITRTDGLIPQNAIFSNFVILLIVLQGIEWVKEKKYVKGILTILLPIIYSCIAVIITIMNVTPLSIVSRIIVFLNFTALVPISYFTEGGDIFLLCGIVLYLTRKNRKVQAISFAVTALILDVGMVYLMLPGTTIHQLVFQYYEWMGAFAAIFMLFYNGERGKGSQKLFYWFYPTHIYVLFGLSCVLYGVLR